MSHSTLYLSVASATHFSERPNVHLVIERLFEQDPEQQFYRRAHGILKMADTYSVMAECLIQIYSDPKSAQRFTLDILEGVLFEEYQSRRQNTFKRH